MDYAMNTPPEQAGLEGYCKVFCEILLESLPDAEVWAFPNPNRPSFTHIFLKHDSRFIDARGIRTLDDIVRDLEPTQSARRITVMEMKESEMISDGDKEEAAILGQRIREHIQSNPRKYGIEGI